MGLLQANRIFVLRHTNYSEKLRWALELSGEEFHEVRIFLVEGQRQLFIRTTCTFIAIVALLSSGLAVTRRWLLPFPPRPRICGHSRSTQ